MMLKLITHSVLVLSLLTPLAFGQGGQGKKAPAKKPPFDIDAGDESAAPAAPKKLLTAPPPAKSPTTLAAQQLYKDAQFLIQDGWEEGKVNYPKVESKLREAVAKDPAFTPAYLLLGKTFEYRKDFNNALAIYRDASRQSADKASGFIELARIYALTGKGGDAYKVIESVINTDPTNARAIICLASLKRRDGDLAGAEKLLRQALGYGTDLADGYKELALVQLQKHEYKQSKLSLLKAIKIKEADASAHNTLGLLALKENDEADAADHFKKAIEVDEQFLPGHLNLSALYLKNGYFEKALAELRLAERLEPKSPSLTNSIGVAYRGLGDYPKAEAAFKQALAMDSDYQPAVYNLGVLYYRYIGDRNKAASFFKSYSGPSASPKAGEDVSVFLNRIELSISKQAEISIAGEREEDAVTRYQRAMQIREGSEKSVRELELAMQEIHLKRLTLEQTMVELDQKASASRGNRNAIERRLSAVMNAQTKAADAKKSGKVLELSSRLSKTKEDHYQTLRTVESAYDDRQGFHRSRSSIEEQFSQIERKFSLAPAKSLATKSNELSLQLAKSEELYRQAFDSSRRAVADRENAIARITRYLQLAGEVQSKANAFDNDFSQATQKLFVIEGQVDSAYNEMHKFEKNRTTLEFGIKDNLAALEAIEKSAMAVGAKLRSLISNHEIDQALIALDKQRETSGVVLETLELKRRELLNGYNDHRAATLEEQQALRAINKQWADEMQRTNAEHDKVAGLLKTQELLREKLDNLLDERKRARFEVDELLKKRNRIDSAKKKVADGLKQEQIDLMTAQKTLAETWSKMQNAAGDAQELDQNAIQISNSLMQVRHGVASSLKDPISVREYRQKLTQFSENQKQLQTAAKKWREQLAVLYGIETNYRRMASAFADSVRDEEAIMSRGQGSLDARAAMMVDRNKEEEATLALLRQREKVADDHGDVEKKLRELMRTRERRLEEREQQLTAELSLERELAAQADKRRDAISRDLLKEFPGKTTSSSSAPMKPKPSTKQ